MAVPGLTLGLEFDAASVAAGEYWRLLTAQLTHFSWSHIAWDLAVFAGLGYLCESRYRCLTYLTLALSTAFISCHCVMHLEQYRGLSGLDTALFSLLGTLLLWQRYRERDWPAVAVFATLLSLMLGKIIWEAVTGNCLFVDAADQFAPVPFAHLVGALVGMFLGCLSKHKVVPSTGREPQELLLNSRYSTSRSDSIR
jgi:rhomboid family GlyGly-CTERM serine protease